MAVLIRPMLVVLTFLIVVVGVVILIFVDFGGDDGDSSGGSGDNTEQAPSRESTEGTIAAADLKVGDCISGANSRTGDVRTFDGVDCDEPHDGEVYTLIRLKGADNAKPPSEAFINRKGQRGCRARLRRQATAKAFKDSQLGFKFVYPTPDSWADGDRDITCVVTFKKPRDKKLAQRS